LQEVDVKAGGGHVMTIGEVSTHFLTKLEWYSTLFPRIPVPIQKQIEQSLLAKKAERLRKGGAVAQGRTDTNRSVQQEDRYSIISCCEAGATFSKLLRKIFGRLLFLRKNAHSRNFFGNFFGRI